MMMFFKVHHTGMNDHIELLVGEGRRSRVGWYEGKCLGPKVRLSAVRGARCAVRGVMWWWWW
jgi:hypothetical protein